jgi:DNA-binding NarL/FixJ family response regulator
MINVILVDDQEIVREGIKMILSLDHEITIQKEAENGKELLELLNEGQHPDVILMDVRMPIMDGVEATKIVKEKYKNIKIIILTTFNEDEYIFEGIKNGADGYILKDAGSDYIIKAIKTAYTGNILLDPEVTTKLVRAYNLIATDKQTLNQPNENKKKLGMLTQREMDVAKLVGLGKSNKEICSVLFLREGTVKNYLTKIFEKLEITSRTELALFINQTFETI